MTTIEVGLDNESYLVFDDPHKAWTLSVLLDIGLHSFGQFENALRLDEYIAKSVPGLLPIKTIAAGLEKTHALVERAGQQADTPACWSFQERDEARQAGQDALDLLTTSFMLR